MREIANCPNCFPRIRLAPAVAQRKHMPLIEIGTGSVDVGIIRLWASVRGSSWAIAPCCWWRVMRHACASSGRR